MPNVRNLWNSFSSVWRYTDAVKINVFSLLYLTWFFKFPVLNYMYLYPSKVYKYLYSLRSSCIVGQTQSLKIIKTSHETDRKYSREQLVMVTNAILRQIFRFQNTDCCNPHVHLILLSVFKYCRMILSYHILIILHCALNI